MKENNNYIVVIGGINIDIGGHSFKPLIAKDSNPGFSTTSLGGVGRNIAHNIRLLGIDVKFLTAFGDDVYAERIEKSCRELGLDISNARKLAGERTSTYIFLNDQTGDMALAVSDMGICDKITSDYLEENISLINGAKLVVIDTNITTEAIKYLAENCKVPIFVDPVSVSKAEKILPYLGKLDTIKPNRLEAELLSGIKITDEHSLNRAVDALLATGLKRVFISLGSEGVLGADKFNRINMPCYNAEVKNATGAGDAFMAGIVYAYLENMELKETCAIAGAAAAIAVEGKETINSAMSVDIIKQKRNSENIF